MNRRYFFFEAELASPMTIGSGGSAYTDCDIIRDSRGKPFIPATSIAGVLASDMDEADKNSLFGEIDGEKSVKSKVIFYDAEYTDEECDISVRDSVGLENKTAKSSAKFDFETVETGACFRVFIELDDLVSESEEKLILGQIKKLGSGIMRFGRKTTRGYGKVRIGSVKRLCFTDNELDKWLDFDMFDEKCWDGAESIPLEYMNDSSKDRIVLSLKMKGALSIRSYTTVLPDIAKGETAAPDYKYLSLKNGRPVIPGTSWAGMFRDRFRSFTDEAAAKELFGYVENKAAHKSAIVFSESVITDGKEKLITRNSIDRFSAATNDGALYTELTVYNGNTELEILFPKSTKYAYKNALLSVIADLDNGFIALGGLTAVGRGLFAVERFEYNGSDVTALFGEYRFDEIIKEAGK